MSSPSIVFVPGSFAQPEFYDNYLEPLISQGYDVHALNLRSALPKDATPPGRPLPTMYDDAAVIAEKLEELSEAGKDIIIVAHSYGGTPASESVKGYSKAAREEKGKRGGVVRLAYMTCLIGDVGQSAGELLQSKTENRIPAELNVDGWMHYTDLEPVARIAFSDMPHEEALEWAARLGWHSSQSFGDPLRYAGYKDVPVSWLLCENDLSIPKEYQETAIELIGRKTQREVHVTAIPAGHVPYGSGLEGVTAWMKNMLDIHSVGR